MLNVTIRQLRAIDAVHACGSFVAAARQLNVTPAALSAMIRESESSLGFRVFERTTRSLRLTDGGEEFMPHVKRVLMDLDRAERFVERLLSADKAVLNIVSTQFLASTVLPPLFHAFRTTEPKARMQLVDSPIDNVIDLLRNGEADIGIFLDTPPDKTLGSIPLFKSSLCVVAHPNHPFSKLEEVHWDQLGDQNIIYLGKEDQLSSDLKAAGINLDFPHRRVEHGTSALALVAAEEGITIVTRYVQPLLPIYGLRMVPLTGPTLRRQVVLLHRKDRKLPPVALKFMEFAKNAKIGDPM